MAHGASCLCDDCCRLARSFAYAYWRLNDFEDYGPGLRDWEPLDGHLGETGWRKRALAQAV